LTAPPDVTCEAEYLIGGPRVHVQALKGVGWRAFVAAPDNDVDALLGLLDSGVPAK
jgi:hypothetical protein